MKLKCRHTIFSPGCRTSSTPLLNVHIMFGLDSGISCRPLPKAKVIFLTCLRHSKHITHLFTLMHVYTVKCPVLWLYTTCFTISANVPLEVSPCLVLTLGPAVDHSLRSSRLTLHQQSIFIWAIICTTSPWLKIFQNLPTSAEHFSLFHYAITFYVPCNIYLKFIF